jgi:hypothetical protein
MAGVAGGAKILSFAGNIDAERILIQSIGIAIEGG